MNIFVFVTNKFFLIKQIRFEMPYFEDQHPINPPDSKYAP